MRFISLAPVVIGMVAMSAAAVRPAHAESAQRISGPYLHENLALYLVHGPSVAGEAPLTLAEALAKGSVRLHETGNVNALLVENTGADGVFIQSGDIVKGGKQDRVLMMSLLLPPRSGKVAIDSFCVEQGRWAPRGAEDVKSFTSSSEALPSRAAKLAMMAPSPKPAEGQATASARPQPSRPSGIVQSVDAGHSTGEKQRKVWAEVSNVQAALASRLGATVAAPQSATSLQLSLENERVKTARAEYISALEGIVAKTDDAVGFVVAIDGRLHNGDLYPSAALFRKMWPKLLAASVTEAIGARGDRKAAAAPAIADVESFLAAASTGERHEATLAGLMDQETRDGPKALYVEARVHKGAWVHRNYLAK